MARRYFGAAVGSLTTFLIGTSLTMLFGDPWNERLVPGLLSSAFVGGYLLWATRPKKTSSPSQQGAR
jgi:hypothetical protein